MPSSLASCLRTLPLLLQVKSSHTPSVSQMRSQSGSTALRASIAKLVWSVLSTRKSSFLHSQTNPLTPYVQSYIWQQNNVCLCRSRRSSYGEPLPGQAAGSGGAAGNTPTSPSAGGGANSGTDSTSGGAAGGASSSASGAPAQATANVAAGGFSPQSYVGAAAAVVAAVVGVL